MLANGAADAVGKLVQRKYKQDDDDYETDEIADGNDFHASISMRQRGNSSQERFSSALGKVSNYDGLENDSLSGREHTTDAQQLESNESTSLRQWPINGADLGVIRTEAASFIDMDPTLSKESIELAARSGNSVDDVKLLDTSSYASPFISTKALRNHFARKFASSRNKPEELEKRFAAIEISMPTNVSSKPDINFAIYLFILLCYLCTKL